MTKVTLKKMNEIKKYVTAIDLIRPLCKHHHLILGIQDKCDFYKGDSIECNNKNCPMLIEVK